MKKIILFVWSMVMLSAAWSAEAAICTSLSAGTWNTAARWSCGHVPVAADTVVVAHNITLNTSSTIAGLTINNGVSLTDDNNNRALTITGDVLVNGTVNTGGGRVSLDITGAASTISGSGTLTSARLYTSGTAVTIAAGSALNFTGSSRLYAGRTEGGATVAGSVLTINGTIATTVPTATTTFLRLYGNSTVVGATGAINGGVSAVTYNTAAATLTNNGSVNIDRITQNAASNAWTQGANSSLTVSAASTVGVLNASANGNTVTYNGTSTVITPSAAGYWNLAGTIFPGACPVAYAVSGTSPCPAGSGSVTSSPSACSSVAGVGTVAWTTPGNALSSNNTYTTAGLAGGVTSNYLNCTGFNFSAIPSGATITGITVYVERMASRATRIRDAVVYLIKGGVIDTAFNGATATPYTTADVVEAHGGAGNLWGTTWTQAEVAAANFGVAFAALNYSAFATVRTASVDHISVKVDYTSEALHHVSINAPASAMSLTEVPVVIAPHTSTHGTITAAGTLNLSTSTGTGDWAIGSGTGTLTPGAANSGLASYTFGAGETSVTLGFTSQTAGTVTLNVASSGGADLLLNTPAGEKANTITFSAASYVFTGSACIHNVAFGTPGQCALVSWSPRTAGLSLANVYITAVNAAGVPTRLHATQVRTRDMQFALSCHDPVANAGVQATFSAAAAALPLCQANGATPATWTAAATLSFPAGSPSVGPYSFNYNDVGQVSLWVRNSAATTETGSSGAFVIKPAGFTLSAIQRASDGFANPGAANAAGTAFVKAGEAFRATVTAVNASGAATPNYGKEAAPESVKLTPTLAAGLGLTNNPALSGSFGAFAGGVATGNAFRWDEVGIITLTPSVGDADYLGAGEVTGTASGNVGRFSLGKFALQNITLDSRADLCQDGVLLADGVTACAPAFTYMGEQINANFTLVPRSLNDASVLNYVDSATAANDFAKLDPTTFANLNMAAVDGANYLTARISNAAMPLVTCAASPCFLSGSADVTAPFTLSRSAAADGPYGTADIGIAPVDSDGARVEGSGATPGLCNNPNAADCYDLDSDAIAGNDHALLATTGFRFGRMKLSNAYGSELLPLTINVAAQFWDGAAYVTNTLDNNSNFPAILGVAGVTDSNYLKNLSSGETSIVTPPASVVFSGGVAGYQLAPPGAGNEGSLDMTVNALSAYLPSANPARATFGVYKGSNEFIYLRENY